LGDHGLQRDGRVAVSSASVVEQNLDFFHWGILA
jgi:hypothetical protein